MSLRAKARREREAAEGLARLRTLASEGEAILPLDKEEIAASEFWHGQVTVDGGAPMTLHEAAKAGLLYKKGPGVILVSPFARSSTITYGTPVRHRPTRGI